MSTFVSFHAHPDDEAIAAGGTMAKAAAAGHRVVLITATRGEVGEPVPGVLDDGEELWQRRVIETHEAAKILGASRVEFLGYEDSGMMGEPTNDNPRCFWQADLEEAAQRLAAILSEEHCDVLTIYDAHGGYGHPDHIQVHRVGQRAAQLAGTRRVFESTMNRDHLLDLMASQQAIELTDGSAVSPEELESQRRALESGEFGSPAAIITHGVDVSAFVELKRAAMVAHASQIPTDSFFLQMPDEAFRLSFGTEWFIRPGHRRGAGDPFADDLFVDVHPDRDTDRG